MLKHKKNNKDRTVKERNKRILNIYSSSHALPEAVASKGTSLPLKKHNKSSIVNLNTKSKQLPKNDKIKCNSSTIKIKPPQVYERIPISFVNSNTNSEIQFSNYGDTIKEANKPFKKSLFIDCDEQALIRQIWRVEKRRKNIQNQAATKIQKVFRGFLTRKLLLKYIEQYQQRLIIQQNLLRRKATFSNQEDSFYNCQLKNSYFSSNKPSKHRQLFNSQDKPSLLQIQSSIMQNDHGHFTSIQDHDILLKPLDQVRKQSFTQKSSFTLNQSSIAQQLPPQISLSFGHQGQPSPHFLQIQNSLNKQFNRQNFSFPKQQIDKNLISVEEDKTRDGISQNISICPSYYRHNRSDKSDPSHLCSVQNEQKSTTEDIFVEKLRSSQKAKWERVIEFVSNNLKNQLNQNRTKELMSTILQFSVKNREQLNKLSLQQQKDITVTPTTLTNRNQEQNSQDRVIDKDFKKKKWQQDYQEKRILKNQNMPLVPRKTEEFGQKQSLYERTFKMKQYFLKTMYLQDQQLDKMLQLRETVLRRKESNSLIQLNNLLQNNLLTQDEFLAKLSELSCRFERHKNQIEQTKNQIYQGYQAQLHLLKNTALDAKYLGYNIPFCRSMEIFPNHPQWRFDSVMIDQLNLLASKRVNFRKHRKQSEQQSENRMVEQIISKQLQHSHEKEQKPEQRQQFHPSSNQDDSINFSYEETNIYRKCQPFSIDVSELQAKDLAYSPKNLRRANMVNKFSSIAVFDFPQPDRDEIRQNEEQKTDLKQNQQEQQQQKCLKRETFRFNADSSQQEQEEVLYKETEQKQIEKIVQLYCKKLIWETVQDIYLNKNLYDVFTMKNNKYAIEIISQQERKSFLQLCIGNIPSFESVEPRINQKMYPNSKQLLMSMRQMDPQIQQQSSQYLQIGQYQYILNQDICYELIEKYLINYRKQRKIKLINTKSIPISNEFKLQYQQFSNQKLKNTAFERKLQNTKILQQIQSSRQEVLRIQLHVMFDAWNEQNKIGYSGIGLNQISLSLIDRLCRDMKQESSYNQMMSKTKQNLEEIITNQNLTDKLNKQYHQTICRNDSQWILYTQQALQYGFDLSKMVELQIIFQFLDQILKMKAFNNEQDQLLQQNSDCSQFTSLNDDQQQQLQKKMENMKKYSLSQQQDSFYS